MPANFGGELETIEKLNGKVYQVHGKKIARENPSPFKGKIINIFLFFSDEFIREMEELQPLFVKEDQILASGFRALKDKNFEKDIDLAKLDIDWTVSLSVFIYEEIQ